ncbi:hypothetical protein H2248_011785 [Termitomyces sp. 'cryptogamus']|nr:hypothetical protein H2248_011785 [Termitomyces sp. 'cryptogamus']
MTYVPGMAGIAHYFRRRRAVALGIAASGSGVGATVHPIMLNSLFHGRAGFRTGVRASAGLNTGLFVIALVEKVVPSGLSKSSSEGRPM